MNSFVLKLSALVVILLAYPSQAQTARETPQKPVRPGLERTIQRGPARDIPVGATYTSADRGCATARKRLWTDAGWIIRRVTACW